MHGRSGSPVNAFEASTHKDVSDVVASTIDPFPPRVAPAVGGNNADAAADDVVENCTALYTLPLHSLYICRHSIHVLSAP